MPLIQRMSTLRSRLNKIPVRLGVPSMQNLLIRHVELDENLLESHTDEVFEAVKVTTVSPKYVGMTVGGGGGGFKAGEGITIAQNDFKAEVPREYSREYLEKDVLYYVVNPPMSDGQVIYNPTTQEPASGIFCKLLMIDDKQDTQWVLLLRQFRDGYDEAIAPDEEVGW